MLQLRSFDIHILGPQYHNWIMKPIPLSLGNECSLKANEHEGGPQPPHLNNIISIKFYNNNIMDPLVANGQGECSTDPVTCYEDKIHLS